MVNYWLNEPDILIDKDYIFNLIPSGYKKRNENFNAITRLIIVIIFLCCLVRPKECINYLSMGLMFLVILSGYFIYLRGSKRREGFSQDLVNKIAPTQPLSNKYYTLPTKQNPFMNVMLPEINQNPYRKRAAPSYLPPIENQIYDLEIDPNLFKDLGDAVSFHDSMRQFYSTPSTTVPNDQEGYLDFLFHNMPSCKDQGYLECTNRAYKYKSKVQFDN